VVVNGIPFEGISLCIITMDWSSGVFTGHVQQDAHRNANRAVKLETRSTNTRRTIETDTRALPNTDWMSQSERALLRAISPR
jgi:hypothetical protein